MVRESISDVLRFLIKKLTTLLISKISVVDWVVQRGSNGSFFLRYFVLFELFGRFKTFNLLCHN